MKRKLFFVSARWGVMFLSQQDKFVFSVVAQFEDYVAPLKKKKKKIYYLLK